jgi:predicted RNA methylase
MALAILLIVPMVIGAVYGAPWVPTPKRAVERMLEIAELKGNEKIIDPGCGDGRILFTAAKLYPNITAVGYELFFIPYLFAKVHSWFVPNVTVHFADSRYVELSDFDVLLCYMLPETLAKLGPIWQKKLKKDAKVISYAFHVANWEPVKILPRIPEKRLARVLMYQMRDVK